MKNKSSDKIVLTSINELLGVVNEESAMEIEICKIHSFFIHSRSWMMKEWMNWWLVSEKMVCWFQYC